MSETANSSATAADLAAADWVQRRHLWAWTDADQTEFDAWLAQSDAHHIAYLRQTAVWNAAGRLNAVRQREPMRSETSFAKPGKRNILRFAVAAAVVATIGFVGTAYLKHPVASIYVTPVGGHKIITLADGTRIELNTDSALQVQSGAVRHVVLLRGEAYFDVRHDAAAPFSVTASGYRVTDLGTKFSIRASADAIKVSLLEGSAVVAPVTGQKAQRSALLMPGDVAIANARKLTLQKEPVTAVANSLGWRHGLLTFKDTELADALAEFNRYNTHKLHIEEAAIGRLKINGTFQAENADLFASSVQELFGLRISRNANQTTLSR